LNSQVNFCYRVYGDNILECELLIDWLRQPTISEFEFIEEIGPVDRPIFIFKDCLTTKLFAFQLCPFYGGTKNIIWSTNQLEGIFNEKPDVLLVQINDKGQESKPILVAEFDDALQAGNQSWQRARRSVDSAKAGIPYFYVLPIIGWERDSDGKSLKNPRYQNAGITIGQLALSSYYNIPSLQIYKHTPWEDIAANGNHTLPKNFKNFSSLQSAIAYSSHLIRESAYGESSFLKPLSALGNIFNEMFIVTKTYCDFSETHLTIHRSHDALDDKNIMTSANHLACNILNKTQTHTKFRLDQITESDFFIRGTLFHKDAQKKTTTNNFRNNVLKKINWKENASLQEKTNWLATWGVRTNSSDPDSIALQNLSKIPVTYKENKSEAVLISNRQVFREIIKTAYPKLNSTIMDWIYDPKKNQKTSSFFIPLYGYKPSGDSRPDRGLIPSLFSMFPKILTKQNTMVLMYSIHTPPNWEKILQGNSNQLWTAIKEFCGLIIVDKTGTGALL